MRYLLKQDLFDLKKGAVVATDINGIITDCSRNYLDEIAVDIYERLGVLEKVTESGEVWVPKVGDHYYYKIGDGNGTGGKTWNNGSFDLYNLAQGNIHPTRTEAQAYADKKIAEGRLLVERSKK